MEPNIDVCKDCLYWKGQGIGCGFNPSISTDAPKCGYKGTAIGLLVGGDMQTFMKWQEVSKGAVKQY